MASEYCCAVDRVEAKLDALVSRVSETRETLARIEERQRFDAIRHTGINTEIAKIRGDLDGIREERVVSKAKMAGAMGLVSTVAAAMAWVANHFVARGS